jgi:hypothetical protein
MTIIDIMFAEEGALLEKEPHLDWEAVRAADLDACHCLVIEAMDWSSPEFLAQYGHLMRTGFVSETIGAEELVERHFDVVQPIDPYGSAIVRLKPAVVARHAETFPSIVDREFVIFSDEDDDAFHESVDGAAFHACPRLWTVSADRCFVERQDVGVFHLHPEHGLRMTRRFVGGALSERILDAVWMGAVGGKRATRMVDAPARLELRVNGGFLERFPWYRRPDHTQGNQRGLFVSDFIGHAVFLLAEEPPA